MRKKILLISGVSVFLLLAYIIFSTPSTTNIAYTRDLSLSHEFQDYPGVIHLHSEYSHDGSTPIPEIARAAASNEINFIIITDHNTLEGLKRKQEGWHHNVFVLIGTEISTETGHYLALGIPPNFMERLKSNNAGDVIKGVNDAGGIGIIAHPDHKRVPWSDWKIRGFQGMEIMNGDSEWRRADIFSLMWASFLYLFNPSYAMLTLVSKPENNLKKWDELTRKSNKIIGVFGSDAHANIQIFRDIRIKFPPFEEVFKLGGVHLLAKEKLSKDNKKNRDLIYSAIRNGNFYNSIDALASGKGFIFSAVDENIKVIMGESIKLSSRVRLRVKLGSPAPMANIKLLRDGVIAKDLIGTSMEFETKIPGVYRVEVYLDKEKIPFGWRKGVPWIFSNPIYVEK